MNPAQDPKPPPGLSPSQTYRWITGRRHLLAADRIDINALEPAERARHFARLRATVDDLLQLCSDLGSTRHSEPPKAPPEVL